MIDLFEQLHKEATRGNCTFRKYSAAVVNNNRIIGIGHARTVDGKKCESCERLRKIKKYGKISEFFEDCNVIHAEICAILDCKDKEQLVGAELYLLGIDSAGYIYIDAFPCANCYKVIEYVGIATINVYTDKSNLKRYEV